MAEEAENAWQSDEDESEQDDTAHAANQSISTTSSRFLPDDSNDAIYQRGPNSMSFIQQTIHVNGTTNNRKPTYLPWYTKFAIAANTLLARLHNATGGFDVDGIFIVTEPGIRFTSGKAVQFTDKGPVLGFIRCAHFGVSTLRREWLSVGLEGKAQICSTFFKLPHSPFCPALPIWTSNTPGRQGQPGAKPSRNEYFKLMQMPLLVGFPDPMCDNPTGRPLGVFLEIVGDHFFYTTAQDVRQRSRMDSSNKSAYGHVVDTKANKSWYQDMRRNDADSLRDPLEAMVRTIANSSLSTQPGRAPPTVPYETLRSWSRRDPSLTYPQDGPQDGLDDEVVETNDLTFMTLYKYVADKVLSYNTLKGYKSEKPYVLSADRNITDEEHRKLIHLMKVRDTAKLKPGAVKAYRPLEWWQETEKQFRPELQGTQGSETMLGRYAQWVFRFARARRDEVYERERQK